MDIADGPLWQVIVADRVDWLISSWHTHRVGLCATTAAILVLFFLRSRTRKLPGRVLDLSPASEEKVSWLEVPKDKTRVTPLSESYEHSGPAPRQPVPSLEPSRLSGPRVIAGQKPARAARKTDLTTDLVLHKTQPLVFFSSLTGTTQKLATAFAENLKHLSSAQAHILEPQLHDLSYVDLDDYFIAGPKAPNSLPSSEIRYFFCFLIPSYDIDTILNTFLAHLDETHNDFRIDTAPLSAL